MTKPARTIRPVSELRPDDEIHTGEIAALFGLSLRHVTNDLTKRADFPKPCTNVSKFTRRWRVRDVVKFKQGR